MSTLSLLQGVEGSINPINQLLAVDLIDLFREEGLLDNSLIGTDGEEGISIRWPESRLFCNISDGKIYISVIPLEHAKLDDIKFDIYESIIDACNKISHIIRI